MAKSAEFILDPALLQIIVVDPHGPPTARIIERYRDDPAVQLVECTSSSDTISIARQLTACLIFIHARNPQDFVQHSLVLKMLQAQIRKKSIRVVLTTSIKSADMLARFTAAGCTEVLSETIGAKQLQFKIDRLLKSLPRPKGAAENAAAADPDGTHKLNGKPKRNTAQAAAEAVEKEAGTVKLEKPLDIRGDCWILQGGSAKRVAGRWLLRFRGPMPDQGKWSSAPPGVVPGAKGDVWEWKPAYPEGVPFKLDEGRWYFVGQRPDFQTEFWILVGREPQLVFYADGKEIGYKAKLNDKGSLLVAKDSGLANQLTEFLRKSRTAARKKSVKQVEEDEIRRSQEAIKRKRAEAAARGDKPEEVGESFEIEEDDPSSPSASPGSPAKKRRRKVEVLYVAPLALEPRESDIWLIELSRPRMAGGKWVVETQGPTLQDGTWIDRAPSAAEGADHLWQWVPTGVEASDLGWMLTGLQPRYSNGVWTMTGSRPSLVFRRGEERLGVKFETLGNGSLSVARDSELAMRTFEAALAERKRRKMKEEDEEEAAVLKSKQEKEAAEGNARFGSGETAEAEASEDGGMDFGEAGESKDPEHRFPLGHFGDPKGKWEHVTAMATGGRMYAFIPLGLREGEITDIRLMPAFWTYVGPAAPRKAGANWIFALNEPERTTDFDALPASAQAYVRGFTSRDGMVSATISVDGPEFRDQGGSGGESPELEARTSSEEAPMLEAQLEAPIALGDGPSATQEGAGLGKEMSATQEAPSEGPMLEATQDGAAAGKELSATQAANAESPELSTTQAAAPQSPELSAEQAAQVSPELASPSAGASPLAPAPPALENRDGAPPASPATGPLSPAAAKLRAGADPALPVISPLALAFLVSELMRKPDLDRKEVGRRYCAYVSSSCAGLRTEIWISRPSGWECAATVDAGPGRCRPAVEAGEGLQSFKSEGTSDAEPVWVSMLRNEAGQLIGALVIGGRGADRMKQEYAKASAQMAYGLMLAYQEAA